MVVFEDGLARKSEYRRFVIRNVDGQNDVASMREVITRRFRRLLDERRAAPDVVGGQIGHGDEGPLLVDLETGKARKFSICGLVIVDGRPRKWPPQDKRSMTWAWMMSVCGLAKRLEEVWLPAQIEPGDLASHQ
ncbi:MAG: hypothetical protein U0R21_08420 [Nocardioidaceae bacterium]